MKNQKNSKPKSIAILAMIFLLISTFVLLTNFIVQAQIPDQQPVSGPLPSGVTVDNMVDTKAFISLRPNPVGVNQIFLVNIWTSPSTHVDRFHPDYKVTITKPSGAQEVITMDSYCADASNWFEWIADEVGEWKLKFDFQGTYFPEGRYYNGYIVTNNSGSELGPAYYNPSSTPEVTLTVQEDIVYSWPESPLPTDYWTRPIPPEHREWWPIAGSFPWFGPGGGPLWDELHPNTNPYRIGMSREPMARFAAWVETPDTAHIAWKRENNLAGLIGGGTMGRDTLDGSSGHPSIILMGRAYQTITKVSPDGPGSQTYWQCYDIRTGEMFWERPLYPGESEPTLIEYGISGLAVPGVQPTPDTPYIISIDDRLLKYDPWTGRLVLNRSVTDVGETPITTGRTSKYYKNGYVVSVQDLGSAAGAERYRLLNWTTFGNTANFRDRIVSNITWPWRNLGHVQDFYRGIAVAANRFEVANAFAGTDMRAASMETGLELWNYTTDRILTSSGGVQIDQGKVAIGILEDRQWICWDLYTGELAWKSEQTAYPWGNMWSYSSESAYGMIFTGTYDALYAFDWDDGKIVWKFTAPAQSQYENPFIDENGTTVHPWHSSLYVADGKIFTYVSRHTPEQPISRGQRWYALDAFTGEEIWSLPGTGINSRVFQGAMADGYLAIDNQYYGTLMVIGKGQSKTTVTAPDFAVPLGTEVVIKGTVLDMSPAQPDTPCVSKESMSTQMAYLHMQFPINGFLNNETITGVPITLTASDQDGNWYDIGTVTTNGYYGTFHCTWTPEEEGTYEIIASFEGDESYGSSAASTAVAVGPPTAPSGTIEPEPETPETPEEPTTPEEPEQPETPTTPETPEEPTTPEQPEPEPTTEAPLITAQTAIIIAIVAICIIGATSYWLLKKK